MYHKLLVAFDGSPDSRRALETGVALAKKLDAELHAVIVEEELPVYATAGALPEAPLTGEVVGIIADQRTAYYDTLREEANRAAQEQGIALDAQVVQGGQVEAIVEYAKRIGSDLLLIGYRKHTMMRDRFLGSTAHALTVASPCCLLAVKASADCIDSPAPSPTPAP